MSNIVTRIELGVRTSTFITVNKHTDLPYVPRENIVYNYMDDIQTYWKLKKCERIADLIFDAHQ